MTTAPPSLGTDIDLTTPVTPKARYATDVQQRGFRFDPAQARAIEHTEALHQRLVQATNGPPGRWRRWFSHRRGPEQGVYLWGGVGRGKTYVMDSFYDTLTCAPKQRLHFDQFMGRVHQRLRALPRSPDPLPLVAGQMAADMRVLCLDEFHVADVADAMILAGLLKGLFDHGVTLVATSNIPVHDLYANGLQRERFLPAIDLLQRHTAVVNLDGEEDFRRHLEDDEQAYGLDADEESLAQQFTALTGAAAAGHTITLHNRIISVKGCRDRVVWFAFDAICGTPRSAADYLEIARRFDTVLVSGIPRLGEGQNDVAQRFILLIDALYDADVKLFARAAVEPHALYGGRQLAFAFERTASRLCEMKSRPYLARQRRA